MPTGSNGQENGRNRSEWKPVSNGTVTGSEIARICPAAILNPICFREWTMVQDLKMYP